MGFWRRKYLQVNKIQFLHLMQEKVAYPVTLTASDGRGETDVITMQVQVVEGPFQPIIQEPGFEDKTLPDGSGDGRDSWRTSIGGVIQITGSPVTFGDQGAKLPS